VKVNAMMLRSLMICVASFCLLGSQQAANAAGPLQGNWILGCSTISGGAAPFTNSVFAFNQQSAGFQAQNSPAPGQPLCTMLGTQFGTLLFGTEVCGIPRSSSGIFIGTVTNGVSMKMFWLDSQGVYLIQGSKF